MLVFMGVAFFVTWRFHADVDAQGGAYATGVLVLITSAACAVTISLWKTRMWWAYLFVTLIFVYTTAVNIYERPEGLKISSFFILAIILVSLISRATRSTELRVTGVELTPNAIDMLGRSPDKVVRLIPRRPKSEPNSAADLDRLDTLVRSTYGLGPEVVFHFLEVERTDASEFCQCLDVDARCVGKHLVLFARSPVVGNSIAALLIHLESTTGVLPHAYFKWKEGNPVTNMLRFVFLGEGDAAPITHEVIRRAIPDPNHRPIIHVS